jgi:hypothetical protein
MALSLRTRRKKNLQKRRGVKLSAIFLIACLLWCLTANVEAGPIQRRNPEAGKKKAAKRIGIGAAIGAGAGGLIGGKKGALIGAGAGAGSGALYHIHKKRSYRKRRNR